MTTAALLEQVKSYYSEKIATYGPTSAGVDWKNSESQILRFDQLVKLIEPNKHFSICDYGCGYGALVDYLIKHNLNFSYYGYDIVPLMLTAAKTEFGHYSNCVFTHEIEEISFDYAIASGIFNVKLEQSIESWEKYILDTLDTLNHLAIDGFSVNFLSDYADRDRMRSDLYYADPCKLFQLCKSRYTKNVALLHDYSLYEFTLIVRK